MAYRHSHKILQTHKKMDFLIKFRQRINAANFIHLVDYIVLTGRRMGWKKKKNIRMFCLKKVKRKCVVEIEKKCVSSGHGDWKNNRENIRIFLLFINLLYYVCVCVCAHFRYRQTIFTHICINSIIDKIEIYVD